MKRARYINRTLLLFIVVGTATFSPAAAPVADADGGARTAPGFTLTDINPASETHGQTVALEDLYADGGVILNFVASWCAPCWDEAPGFQKLREEAALPIVCVAADEYGPTDDLLRKAGAARLSMPILHVPRERIEQMESLYDHAMLPATYVIDTEGTIRDVFQGAIPPATLLDRASHLLSR